jgi:hypothetical protein
MVGGCHVWQHCLISEVFTQAVLLLNVVGWAMQALAWQMLTPVCSCSNVSACSFCKGVGSNDS